MPRQPSEEKIHNKKELVGQRKELRNNATSAEATLWMLLKRKQLLGRKFRRQHSVGNYVLDFYCPSENLAVELDGEPHFTEEGMSHDQVRTSFVLSLGIRIVRFENCEVFQNPKGVLDEISKHFERCHHNHSRYAESKFPRLFSSYALPKFTNKDLGKA